jgi:hypothetical protein
MCNKCYTQAWRRKEERKEKRKERRKEDYT